MSDDGMQPVQEPRLVRSVGFLSSRSGRRIEWGIFIAILGLFVGIGVWDISNARQQRDRLRHQTDLHALLKACRDLMQQHPNVRIEDLDHDPRIPEVIRRLGASYITIQSDCVHIELHSVFSHYAVEAFAEGAGRERGLKLIDGLWYYSAG